MATTAKVIFKRDLRSKIQDFRARAQQGRRLRRERLSGQKARCQAEAREKAKAIRLLYKEREKILHEERRIEIEAARKICTMESASILEEERARMAALEEERRIYEAWWREEWARRFPRRELTPAQKAARARAAEKRSELDQEVERDIEATAPELVPLWRSWGRKMKRVKGMSRYEAFLHAVHELGETELVAQLARAAHISDEKFARDQATHYEEWAKANEARKQGLATRLSKNTIVPF